MMPQTIPVYKKLLFVFIFLIFALNCISVFFGFTHVDEADIVFDILKIYKNLAVDRSLSFAVWPDTGMNGPLHYYIYTILLFPLSYLLRIPVDIALRIVPLCTLIVTALYLFKTFKRLFGSKTALITTMLFTSSVYFTFYVTLSLGEVWYTMFLSISLYFLIKAENKRDVYLAFCFYALPLMIKYTFITLLPMYVILTIMNWSKLKPRIMDFVGWALVVASGFIPLLLSLLLNSTEFLSRFSQISMYTKLAFSKKILYLFYYMLFGFGPITFFLFVKGAFARKSNYQRRDIYLIACFVATILAVFITGAITFRYIYPIIFPFFFLVGLGVQRFEKSQFIKIVYPLIFINLCIGVYTQVLNNYEPNWRNNIKRRSSIYRQAGEYAIQNSSDRDIIVLGNPTSFYVFGKRSMILNPLYETFEESGNTFSFQFMMDGVFDYMVDERIKYFIITEDELKHHRIPQEFMAMLLLEEKYGSVGIYRNILYEGSGLPKSSEKLKYDLRSIVQDYNREGVLSPRFPMSKE